MAFREIKIKDKRAENTQAFPERSSEATYSLRDHKLPAPFPIKQSERLESLPRSMQHRSIPYLLSQFFKSSVHTDTGLAHLSTEQFMEVARATRAFAFAVETFLRSGWWSSLLQKELLTAPQAKTYRLYLESKLAGADVVEIGAGDKANRHRRIVKALGALSYTAIDKQDFTREQKALTIDALEFFSQLPENSVDVIMAFGVFNEPMSLQFPAGRRGTLCLPASSPALATRVHAEHEYVRRLSSSMLRALRPEGILFGDGLYSRSFETEVATYLALAGFIDDAEGLASLSEVDPEKYNIRQAFFFKSPKGKKL